MDVSGIVYIGESKTTMRILIDIGHPAHVHYFRNFIKLMKDRGHEFLVISREKEITNQLLNNYDIPFVSRGKGSSNVKGKIIYFFKAIWFLYTRTRKFKPDLAISVTAYTPLIAWLNRVPSIVLNDTEHAKLHHLICFPFANYILTPECYRLDLGKKQIRFKGYLELCYLHPNMFKPNPGILEEIGIENDEKYVIFRFVSWEAAHDVGHSGLSLKTKQKAAHELSKHARVFITSEGKLPEDLEQYRIKFPPEKIHDALAFSSLLYGESATMASECACLGVPSIFHDNDGRGYTDEEEEEYGLVFNYTESEEDQERSLEKALEIINETQNDKWKESAKKLLSEKIDVTSFLIWFVEKYPESVQSMKSDPDNTQKTFSAID